jgi:thioredoxin reductase (NADPH)
MMRRVAQEPYDLVVVGAGLAGLTAGLIGARHGLKTVIVEHMASGGQVLNVEKIENFPGFPQGIAGFELGPLVQEQAEAAGCSFVMDTAESVTIDADRRVLRCAESELVSKAMIVAAGSALRSLGIPGEEEFFGRGVSKCASCDAPMFGGKEVCVVGGGDSAVDEAAVLAEHVSKVTIFHRGSAFRAQAAAQARLAEKSNVETMFGTELVEISGDGAVSAVTLRDVSSGATRVQEMAGVFVFVGLDPNTSFLQGVVDLDSSGHVITDVRLQTSVPGIFAAGDIRQHSVAQLAAVAGDGATAAVNAYRYIKGLG